MMDFGKNGPIPNKSHFLMSVTKLSDPKIQSLLNTLQNLKLFEEVNIDRHVTRIELVHKVHYIRH